MRKFLPLVLCAGLTSCQSFQMQQGSDDGANYLIAVPAGSVGDGSGAMMATAPAPAMVQAPAAQPAAAQPVVLQTVPATPPPAAAMAMAGPPASVPPPHNLEAIFNGPEGQRVVYLQVSDADVASLTGRTGSNPARPPEPVVVQANPGNDPLRLMQADLAYRLSMAINDLKEKVLEAREKMHPDAASEPNLESVKASIQALKRQVAELSDRVVALRRTEKVAAPADTTLDFPTRTVAYHPPEKLSSAVAQDSAPEVPTLSQQEINQLVAQCLRELKREMADLNNRLAAISPPPVSTK